MHTTTTNAPFLVLNIFLLWLGLCTLRTLPALSAAASQIFCALAAKEGRVRSYVRLSFAFFQGHYIRLICPAPDH